MSHLRFNSRFTIPSKSLRCVPLVVVLVLLGVLSVPVRGADGGSAIDAAAAFERLKALEGTWSGMPEGEGEAKAEAEIQDETTHELRVSAAGHVLMETMAAGTEHEMINMYHLDGEELLVTHYCSGGNQPRMRLDRAQSTPDHLVFELLDATGLEPDEHHIGSIHMRFAEDGRLNSEWLGYRDGELIGTMTFHLARTGK